MLYFFIQHDVPPGAIGTAKYLRTFFGKLLNGDVIVTNDSIHLFTKYKRRDES